MDEKFKRDILGVKWEQEVVFKGSIVEKIVYMKIYRTRREVLGEDGAQETLKK